MGQPLPFFAGKQRGGASGKSERMVRPCSCPLLCFRVNLSCQQEQSKSPDQNETAYACHEQDLHPAWHTCSRNPWIIETGAICIGKIHKPRWPSGDLILLRHIRRAVGAPLLQPGVNGPSKFW